MSKREFELTRQLYGDGDSATPKKPERFPTTAEEVWLARRLGSPALFAGRTSAEERRERVRAAILERGFADRRAGMRNGTPETFRELFARLWGVPLEPKP